MTDTIVYISISHLPQIIFDKVPYDDAPVDSVVIARVIQGILPIKIEGLLVSDHIKRLFTQCWVGKPDDRIEMVLCSKGVADALLELPLR